MLNNSVRIYFTETNNTYLDVKHIKKIIGASTPQ